MKEILIRGLSGLLYITLLVTCLNNEYAVILLFFVFGLICISEFKKLIQFKGLLPYLTFSILYAVFCFWQLLLDTKTGLDESAKTLLFLSILVNLFLIKNLFSENKNILTNFKRFFITTFYISNTFIFLALIANNYNPSILLGAFILIWTNDSFAYLVGKNFGKKKLFEKISPKKTVEGFIGGLIFSCIASYIIASFNSNLSLISWLLLSIITSVFGTLGDLIESKFKRQAGVKDSGTIMPGHGGLLDRLDSIIFTAPFIYLFLIILHYVS